LHDVLLLIVYAILIKILILKNHKGFRRHFAISCFKKALEEDTEVGMMRYLIMGLDSYNKYLKKHLRLQINDLPQIYSNISHIGDKQAFITKISVAIEKEKLEPILALLSPFLKNPEKSPLLIKEQYIYQISRLE
jgi:hypothetical protein